MAIGTPRSAEAVNTFGSRAAREAPTRGCRAFIMASSPAISPAQQATFRYGHPFCGIALAAFSRNRIGLSIELSAQRRTFRPKSDSIWLRDVIPTPAPGQDFSTKVDYDCGLFLSSFREMRRDFAFTVAMVAHWRFEAVVHSAILEDMNPVTRKSKKAVPAQAETMPRTGLREQNKMAKYNRILEAGRALFNERGYEATTTQAVAKAAGIGVGTLFSYVNTKEDLLIIVFMDDLQNAVHAAFRKVRAEDRLVDRVLTLYGGLLQYHITNFGLSRYLMREVVNVSSSSARAKGSGLMEEINKYVTSFIEAEQNDRGYSANFDTKMLSANCFAIYYDVLQSAENEGGSLAGVSETLRDRMKLQIEPYYIR